MISNKIKWSIGLVLIILLILATNFIDRNNFKRIQDSVSTIYDDRLIAKDLIYNMQLEMHKKQLLLAKQQDSTLVLNSNAAQKQINEYIDSFSNTALTREEEQVFTKLQQQFNQLYTIENDNNPLDSNNLENQIASIKTSLDKLSDIQIEEGNRQMFIGEKAMESMELLTQMEIWIVIVLGIIVQFVILYSPRKSEE
ncbi:MAG: MCP four helix bundle domain-containing protein [Nonlabens sp.]|uniref:MCP four helix bundle domain-containing protein n=1 Tax=Nonlabens sp. TaxID=1888209 RepID=UPI003EF766A7